MKERKVVIVANSAAIVEYMSTHIEVEFNHVGQWVGANSRVERDHLRLHYGLGGGSLTVHEVQNRRGLTRYMVMSGEVNQLSDVQHITDQVKLHKRFPDALRAARKRLRRAARRSLREQGPRVDTESGQVRTTGNVE